MIDVTLLFYSKELRHVIDYRLADAVKAVCPQKLPNLRNESEALSRMPKGRLEYLKRLLPHLRNQSEDCLFLNLYVPSSGKYNGPFLFPCFTENINFPWKRIVGVKWKENTLKKTCNILLIHLTKQTLLQNDKTSD